MNNKITQIAKQVVEAKEANKKSHIVNKINFNLTESGYCYRFVRQVIEAANDFNEFTWIYKAPTAYDGELLIKKDFKPIPLSKATPGNIIFFNDQNKKPGHVAILLDKQTIIENTSNKYRGHPKAAGHKITPLTKDLIDRISGIYNLYPEEQNIKYKNKLITGKIEDDTMYVKLRDMCNLFNKDIVIEDTLYIINDKNNVKGDK